MSRRLVSAGIAVILAMTLTSVQAEFALAQSWKKIATQDVDLAIGQASIDIQAAPGKYRSLRVYALGARIVMSNIKVVYANAQAFNERRRINLLDGERTRPINTLRNGRFVDRLDLTYRPQPNASADVTIEVWGLQSRGEARAVRPRPPIASTGVVALPPDTGGGPGADSGTIFFGVKSVDFAADSDVIVVGREIGKFSKIRLRVRDNAVYLNSLTVVYADGQADVVAYDAQVPAETRTRWLDLKGDRFIKQIELSYRSKPNFRGRARVEVYGEFAEGWLGPSGAGKKFNRGWVYLGGQSPLFFSIRRGLGYQRDVVTVGANKGGFSKLRVDVRDRAITLRELTVVYIDNAGRRTVDIIPVKRKVAAGTSYGPVDLQGRGRTIQEIRVRYRSRLLDASAKSRSYAFVEFWGKH